MSGRLLRWLVAAYPQSFRERWGEETIEAAEVLISRARARGTLAAGWLTVRIAFDLGRGALVERSIERRTPARHSARRQLRERSPVMLDGLAFDLRDALRGIRRAPLHAAGVALTLALGIGANAAIFAVVYHVVLAPLPYADPDRLVLLWEKNPERGWDQAQVAPANYLDWRAQATSYESSAGFGDWLNGEILSAPGEPEGVQTMYVAGDLFGVLGVPVALGRSFGADEFWRADAGVAVISDRLWRERFDADSGVVGRSLTVDGDALTIIGVAPDGFAFHFDETDLWRPFGWRPEAREQIWFRRAHLMRAVARLAPGRTVEDAGAELETIAARLERRYPETNTLMGAGATLYARFLTGPVARPLTLVYVAVALVLLVACANVAHLQLAHATARETEQAVRGCLGASRWRLARRTLLEQALLGTAGGLLGLAVARAGLPLLLSLGGVELPRLGEVRIGFVVFAFTASLSLLAAAVAGVAPALRGGADLDRRLREAGRGGVGLRPARIRSLLVAAEMTFAAVVVAGALLLVRSFVELGRVDPGYDPESVITARVSLPGGTYSQDDHVAAFVARLLERVRALPGVESAGLVRKLPTTEDSWSSDFAIKGRGREEFGIEVVHRETTTGYFETMHVPLVDGRFFDARDDAAGTPVAIVNRTLAERYFPEGDAVGARIAFDRYPTEESSWYRIVGVVRDERQSSLASPVRPEIFRPIAQDAIASFFLAVRSPLPAERVIPELRRALAEIDPGLPLLEPRSMTSVLSASRARERFLLALFTAFGGLALALAALGVYGVTAHAAAGRRREIGVRMALGAGRRTVVRGFVRRGLVGVAVGLAAGVGGAVALGRAMSSLLYGVEPLDPASLLAAPALLLALAIAASWWPAWRASRVAPAEVLRAE